MCGDRLSVTIEHVRPLTVLPLCERSFQRGELLWINSAAVDRAQRVCRISKAIRRGQRRGAIQRVIGRFIALTNSSVVIEILCVFAACEKTIGDFLFRDEREPERTSLERVEVRFR